MPDWTLTTLRAHLTAALAGPLPGASAQARLAPVPRPGWDPRVAPPPGRPAAVLGLCYPLADEGGGDRPALLYTVRTESVEAHRGQLSFPGGCLEAGESPEEAALREAREEADVPPEDVHLLGRLTPLWIPATGYLVTPIVGVASRRPDFRGNPQEVERILEVPVANLLQPEAVLTEECSREGRWTRVRYFDIAGTRLWGATAMITAELLALLGW